MTQKISPYYGFLIFILSLLLNTLLLIMLVIVPLENSQQEATVLLAHDEEQPQPERDWVTINNALPATQAPTPQPQEQATPEIPAEQVAKEEPPQEIQHELNEQAIENAISIANKLLAQAKQSTPKEEEKQLAKTPEALIKPPASITLAQLTQGFLQHLQESPMAVRGNRDGQASMEQLQHIHYCQKIIGCVVTSYKINRTNTIQSHGMQPTRIQLALNRDGTIHTLNIVQSTGNHTTDQFLLHMFQDASSSFPPLPSSFKEHPYYLPLFNVDRLEAFQSENGWYIDNTVR